MSRISLQEQYDNKDVIQQIKILKDSYEATKETADEAVDSIQGAINSANSAAISAEMANQSANSAVTHVEALTVKVNENTTAIEQVQIEAEQALTDANDAFDQASITQTAEAATITMTRGTGSQERIPFPIASSVQTGMMNAQTYAGIVNLNARVTKLEASKTVFYVTFSSDPPSESELTSLFTTVSGRSPVEGDYLTDIAKSLTYGYNGTNWIKVETSGDVPLFTSESPGLIKGSTLDGTVAAETDGTGSVNGWDNVKTTLNNHTESIGTIESSLSTVEGTVSTIEGEVASLSVDKNDKLNAVTVTLTVAGWVSNTQTVSASNVKADNIVWVSPAPASFDAYGKAGIRAIAQADGTITFTCTKIPAVEMTVEVVA